MNTYFLSLLIEHGKRKEFKVIQKTKREKKLKKRKIFILRTLYDTILVCSKQYGIGIFDIGFFEVTDELGKPRWVEDNWDDIISFFSKKLPFRGRNLLMRINHNVLFSLRDLIHFP
jgi:hypothetical protein